MIAGCSSEKDKTLGRATASERATVGTSGAADIANRDAKDFIQHIAIANLAEIQLGKLATERATADEVKKFGRMMVDEHTASGAKLKALASDLKIESPGQLDDKHIDQRDNLAKRPGADFDHEYASSMVDGHKDLIGQLEPRIDKKTLDQWKIEMNAQATGAAGTTAVLPDKSDNPTTMRINQFAADIYPNVHAHLAAAKTLESSIKKRTKP
jgi:predicted outer membrane protein